MRGVYVANYRIATVTTGPKTLMYVTAPAAVAVEVIAASVTNENNESNEQMILCIQKITTLGTPTATTITPAKVEAGDQAAASTVKANVTASEPTYGAIAQGAAIADVHGLQGIPSLNGWTLGDFVERRLVIPPSVSYGLRLVLTVASVDLAIEWVFREVG